MLAHELRNPLAPIRNALHLIQLDAPAQPPSLQENWSIIDRQVTHLVRLVDDLLDVSRISQGKIHLQRQALDLADVVARAVESSRPLIDARKHTLNVHLSEGLLAVEGDPVRLVQVLSNLLNNAAKYTHEGGRIDLTVQRDGDEAAIRVADTGVGIAPEILPRLFDPFTQSERTLERADGGLGIGLTLVRRLTEMHGGRVEAHSAGLGEGSTFVVRLPLLPIDDRRLPIEETVAAESPNRQSTIDDRKSRKVLVVDDNPDSTRTLTRLLERLGHEVRSATDGPGALAAMEKFGAEVVLLDIGLPGMDGFEVARRLRGIPKFKQSILVALTGYGSPEDRQRSEEAGFNAHLVKPVDLDALTGLLASPRPDEPEA
jgi:CheY-like chemotaxis protein/two-component sensor histidine kinase